MNKLELIAIDKLQGEIVDILQRSDNSNSERIQHEQLFINGSAKRALELIKALKENNEQ